MFYRDVILEEVMPINEFNIKTILHTIKEKLLQFLSWIRKIIKEIQNKLSNKKNKIREKQFEDMEREASKKGTITFEDVFEENDKDLNIKITYSEKYRSIYSLHAKVIDWVKDENCTKETIYSKIGTSNFSSLFDKTKIINVYNYVKFEELNDGLSSILINLRTDLRIDGEYELGESDERYGTVLKQLKNDEKILQDYIEELKRLEEEKGIYSDEKLRKYINIYKIRVLKYSIFVQWDIAYLENIKKNEKEYDTLIDRIYRRFGQYIKSQGV